MWLGHGFENFSDHKALDYSTFPFTDKQKQLSIYFTHCSFAFFLYLIHLC